MNIKDYDEDARGAAPVLRFPLSRTTPAGSAAAAQRCRRRRRSPPPWHDQGAVTRAVGAGDQLPRHLVGYT